MKPADTHINEKKKLKHILTHDNIHLDESIVLLQAQVILNLTIIVENTILKSVFCKVRVIFEMKERNIITIPKRKIESRI